MTTAGRARSARPDPLSGMDWFIHHVYEDPEFIADVAALKELERETGDSSEIHVFRQGIASKFSITVPQINRYIVSQIIYLSHETSSASLDIDLFRGEFAIKFGPHTSQAEIREQWDNFEQVRNELFPAEATKRKPPQNPDLLYAIFKCRQRNMTFPEIYKLYSTGTLPGYSGSANQYGDEELLERYYDKYKPES